MITNTVKPFRLNKDFLLKDDPICLETKSFSKKYDAAITVADLYSHEIIEIDLVVAGNGVHRVLNQAIPCKAGDIYITYSDTPHAFFSADTTEALTVRRLWFDPVDWFEGELCIPTSTRCCYGVFSDSALTAYAMLTNRTQNEINGLLNAIICEVTEKKAEWHEAIRAHLANLLITVSRYVGDAIKSFPTIHPKEWGAVSAVIRAVMENFGNCDLTLGTIADELYVSKSHLSRQFKQLTGNSFSDYLRTLRLNHACHLLRETRLTVEEIAVQCGLRDIPSFYKSFHLYKGVTPHQYRINKTSTDRKDTDKHPEALLQEISGRLQRGRSNEVLETIALALDAGIAVETILRDGLLHGMSIIGEKFKNGTVYVPEVLVSARAMNMGVQMLKPYLAAGGVSTIGRVCIGTVQGDLHDIGKNLVKMMMEGKGLEVIDLGTDVPPEVFVRTAIEQHCQIICCSALLTTTMGVIGDVVRIANESGVRDKVKILIGGAPTNEAFCREIGADYYTSDAASAADTAVAICQGML